MERWKRNLLVIWVAELVAVAGFYVALPFLPYYVQELGIQAPGQVALWSGLIIGVQGLTMAIFSPVWGGLADRYGRKLMIERAMFSGAIVSTAMGLVQTPGQLVVLRALQGTLAGTVAAATTLVASSTPRAQIGYALGLLQMAVWIGASVGPLIGGLVADTWGYRSVFFVTGGLLLIAGVTVWRYVHEDFKPLSGKDRVHSGFWQGMQVVLGMPSLVTLLSVRVISRLGTSLIAPLLPLFIQALAPSAERVASLTGLISGISAATTAVSAVVLGRAVDRLGHRPVLIITLAASAALYVPHYWVRDNWQVVLLQAAAGFAIGGVLTALSASLAHLAPEGRQGAVYGLEASAVAAASALAPMIGAGVGAAMGLRVPFLLAGGALALSCVMAAGLIPGHREDRLSRG